MNIQYIGEHLFPGQLGNFFVVLALISALVSGVAYFLAEQGKDEDWLKLGRWSFFVHGFSVIVVIALVFYLIFNQYFEYDYVWKHSNKSMPLRYIFACFWEGQEGSYLLWMFWHVVLGSILIFRAKKWEAPVLSIFALVQLFLCSMMLGIYVLDHKIGSSPFILIRNLPDNIGLPWTMLPDYLSKIPQFADGRGLNPLLQNYWMTIHPPTLFLGFAATLIPFAFAIAALWRKDLQAWLKPALPWTFFGIMVLGIGILMGGAWAYEALSFGGFWAWDPVENASLVPWLILVGAGHLILINLRKNNSIFTTLLLSLLSFLLVLYSTFLTRSGVLGETSVHSFTDNGMTGQLLLYLLAFVALAVLMLIQHTASRYAYAGIAASCLVLMAGLDEPVYPLIALLVLSAIWLIYTYNKHFPKPAEEENLWSREFWLFIASLVLMLSAAQISFSTSTPVFNLLLQPFSAVFTSLHETTGFQLFKNMADAKFAPPLDAITHYNKWQIPFAFLTTILIAVGQFFSYKKTDMKVFAKKMALAFGLSILSSIAIAVIYDFGKEQLSLILLLFSAVFALVANLDYLFRIGKTKFGFSGSSIAHIGFALVMLGALISTGKSKKISENQTTFDLSKLDKKFKDNENILLFKGDTVAMDNYFIRYKNRSKEDINVYYEIEYFGLKPNSYVTGDLVISQGLAFECKAAHQCNAYFLADQDKYWKLIDNPTTAQLRQAKLWNANRPGDKLFELKPRVQLNPKFGNVAEPDTKHYLNKDIYTHVQWAEIEAPKVDQDGYLDGKEHVIAEGDSMFTSRGIIVFEDLTGVSDYEKYRLLPTDVAAMAKLKVVVSGGNTYQAEPLFILRDNTLQVPDVAEVKEAGIKVAITNIDPTTRKITFTVAEHQRNTREFIVMQAIIFPSINVLWLGIILMGIGTLIAVRQRFIQGRTTK